MPGIADVATEFGKFARDLSARRPKEVARIETLSNGFEGWLKLEFFFWLVTTRKLEPSTPKTGERDVGLEYKVRLDQRKADRFAKQCDLWIRNQSGSSFHYVELKAPFAEFNQSKVLISAADDFWYMSRIRASCEEPASGNAIVLGVGFEEESWRQAIEYVIEKARPVDNMEPPRSGVLGSSGRVRFSVLTKRYSESWPTR
ncbi:MAG: hypothetical protein JW913_02365 [Chitinispirillaceae bacterium]|nr:hypothetical protein [Chitinispirillaceae bacterium]